MKSRILILIFYVLPVIGILVNFYISNHAQTEWLIIKFLQTELFQMNIFILITIIWLGVIATLDVVKYVKKQQTDVFESKEKALNEKINDLKESINEKNNLLQNKAGSLMDKYVELYQYKERQALWVNLMNFTKDNPIVHSTQLYEYTTKVLADTTQIKVEYVNGFTPEGIDINAIVQSYYSVKNLDYNQLLRIFNLCNQINSIEYTDYDTLDSKNKIKTQLEDNLYECIEEFVTDKITKLKNKEDLDEEDSVIHSLVRICLEILYQQNGDPLKIIILDEDKDRNINNIKRTGILNGIVKQDEHIFKNEGESNKKGRIYITRTFKFNNKNYIMMLSVLQNVVEYENWEKVIKKLSYELLATLNNDFNIHYNNKTTPLIRKI